jgi:hypothetical protein
MGIQIAMRPRDRRPIEVGGDGSPARRQSRAARRIPCEPNDRRRQRIHVVGRHECHLLPVGQRRQHPGGGVAKRRARRDRRHTGGECGQEAAATPGSPVAVRQHGEVGGGEVRGHRRRGQGVGQNRPRRQPARAERAREVVRPRQTARRR